MDEANYDELKTRFVRSFLDIVVVRMLLDEASWGYRLMTWIKDRYNVKVGPPIMYPLLDSLQSEGLITGEEVYLGNRLRKVYSVTPKGKERVSIFEKVLREFV